MEHYLFVYGTLLSSMQHALYAQIAPYVKFIGHARFQGKLYDIHGYPGAMASLEPNEWVLGELYRLQNTDKLFYLVDEYEACSEEFPTPTEYIRQKMPVITQSDEHMTAWIYLYNWQVNESQRIKSGDYVGFTHGYNP